VSLTLDAQPPPPGADPDVALWEIVPGLVNPELLKLSPDHRALQTVIWDSLSLAITFNVTGKLAYADKARALLGTAFFGGNAIAPHMRYARMIPTVSLDELRTNILGFREMDDVPLALYAAHLLQLTAAQLQGMRTWMTCVPPPRTRTPGPPAAATASHACAEGA
jgi:hypothetical protein